MQDFSVTNYRIKDEINYIFLKMGADSSLLSIIGSWKETMPDEFILKALKGYSVDMGYKEEK